MLLVFGALLYFSSPSLFLIYNLIVLFCNRLLIYSDTSFSSLNPRVAPQEQNRDIYVFCLVYTIHVKSVL